MVSPWYRIEDHGDAGTPADLVLIEGFQYPMRPVILVGPQKTDGVIEDVWATFPTVTEMSAEVLETELTGLAKTILARLHRSPASAEIHESMT